MGNQSWWLNGTDYQVRVENYPPHGIRKELSLPTIGEGKDQLAEKESHGSYACRNNTTKRGNIPIALPKDGPGNVFEHFRIALNVKKKMVQMKMQRNQTEQKYILGYILSNFVRWAKLYKASLLSGRSQPHPGPRNSKAKLQNTIAWDMWMPPQKWETGRCHRVSKAPWVYHKPKPNIPRCLHWALVVITGSYFIWCMPNYTSEICISFN